MKAISEHPVCAHGVTQLVIDISMLHVFDNKLITNEFKEKYSLVSQTAISEYCQRKDSQKSTGGTSKSAGSNINRLRLDLPRHALLPRFRCYLTFGTLGLQLSGVTLVRTKKSFSHLPVMRRRRDG